MNALFFAFAIVVCCLHMNEFALICIDLFGHSSNEGFPLMPCSNLSQVHSLTPSLANNKDKRGLALNGKLKVKIIVSMGERNNLSLNISHSTFSSRSLANSSRTEICKKPSRTDPGRIDDVRLSGDRIEKQMCGISLSDFSIDHVDTVKKKKRASLCWHVFSNESGRSFMMMS